MKSRSIKIFLLLAVLAISLISASSHNAAMAQSSNTVNISFPCPNGTFGPCPDTTNDITVYLNNLYKFAVGIVGLMALGMIVAGGVYYSLSAGNSGRQGEARSMITSAIVGALLLLCSYLILNTINPQITTLKLNLSGLENKSTSTLEGAETGVNDKCADFSSLGLWGLSSTGLNCGTRENVLNMDVTLSNNQYYDDNVIFKTGIDKGSLVWLYPYYVSGGDPSKDAVCLIYAYREANDATKMVKLNENMRLCSPQDQKSNASCSEWTFTADATNGVMTPGCIPGITCPTMTPVSVPIAVNSGFNFPNADNPPPIDASNGCPTSVFYSHCWNQSYTCTKN